MERETDDEPDNKSARNADSALMCERKPLEPQGFPPCPAFFRSLLDRALTAARRAVALSPSSHAAHHALASVHFFRHELEAFRFETDRALSLNPNDPAVLARAGIYLHYVGDDRGVALVRKAMKLDPFHSPACNLLIADDHFDKGEYDEALAIARKADLPAYYYSPLLLAAISAELGRQDEAASALAELQRVWPGCSVEAFTKDMRNWNVPEARINRLIAALRKAGLPE